MTFHYEPPLPPLVAGTSSLGLGALRRALGPCELPIDRAAADEPGSALASVLARLPAHLRAALEGSREAERSAARCLEPHGHPRWCQPVSRVLEFWAERLVHVEATQLAAVLASMRSLDLWLACACVHGEPAALDRFVVEHSPLIRRAIASLGLPDEELEDIAQDVLRLLLVGDEAGRRLVGFGCRGSLRGWVRTFAIRTAQARLRGRVRRTRRDVATAAEILTRAEPSLDAEQDLVRLERARLLRTSMGEAIGSLSEREREVLRLNFMQGVRIGEIGAELGVHRATVARWIATAREKLYKRSLDILHRRYRLTRHEVEQLVEDLTGRCELGLEPALTLEP